MWVFTVVARAGVRSWVWRAAIKRCWYTKSILGWQPSLNHGDNKTITNTLFMGGRLLVWDICDCVLMPRTKTTAINFTEITSQQLKQTIIDAKHSDIWDINVYKQFFWAIRRIFSIFRMHWRCWQIVFNILGTLYKMFVLATFTITSGFFFLMVSEQHFLAI